MSNLGKQKAEHALRLTEQRIENTQDDKEEASVGDEVRHVR